MGLALPFAALAGGALGFISPRLLFPAVSLFPFFFFTCLLCEALHTPLCDALMNFSLCCTSSCITCLLLYLLLGCLIGSFEILLACNNKKKNVY